MLFDTVKPVLCHRKLFLGFHVHVRPHLQNARALVEPVPGGPPRYCLHSSRLPQVTIHLKFKVSYFCRK